ncbi:response regulator transcription factor [Clostridium estertheticum]|uniref:response regulator n=1 Tax=Clostridium estertheticum TaxID=238834 RepID=UPI0013E93D0C|nr:response regulator transcription factor [Clostridium estertheticum]MBZ9687704.1 response regulator transcription factor [Clostridium estertheticum]
MKKEEIKVLIADDHDLIRQGLMRIISFEDDIIIVGEAENGEKVLDMLKSCEPDVILLDMKMPLMDGLEVLQRVKEKLKSIKIIMLTVENDMTFILDAINNGADGYVLKDSAGTEIVEAIRTVYGGDKYIDKLLVSALFSGFKIKEKNKQCILDSLSKREIEVLLYISKGLSNKDIGERLFISEKTVKNYATNLFRKIGAHDRVHAAIFALDQHIQLYYESKFQE